MKTASSILATSQSRHWRAVYALLVGLFLGLSLIKFGNPVILDHLIGQTSSAAAKNTPGLGLFMQDAQKAPSNWVEDMYEPWTFHRGLWFVGLLVLLAFKDSAWKTPPPRWVWLPLIVWFLWQIAASFQTVNVNLTRPTLAQFAACLGCLFIGWHGLPQGREIRYFWAPVAFALGLVLWRGFTQHHGGLEAMRNYVYEQPNWQQFAPDLLKRVTGGRIFGTLVYPNALAGVILLLLAPVAFAVWQICERLPNVAKGLAVGFIVYLGVACLVWTGSKSGWLIALGIMAAGLCQLRLSRRTRSLIVIALCVGGVLGFFVRYSKYFERGATSMSARFDYWRAAVQTASSHPLLGTGPGTFMDSYKRLKRPDSEMARLAHNDYLQQASDSGLPGFLGWLGFVGGGLYCLYRKSWRDPLRVATLLGVSALFAQSMVEFGLYIPAVAWPTLTLFGWLLAGWDAPSGGDPMPSAAP